MTLGTTLPPVGSLISLTMDYKHIKFGIIIKHRDEIFIYMNILWADWTTHEYGREAQLSCQCGNGYYHYHVVVEG